VKGESRIDTALLHGITRDAIIGTKEPKYRRCAVQQRTNTRNALQVQLYEDWANEQVQ